MRSILRFVFVVVPTAALAGAVVIAVSRNDQGAVADGDLQRDLQLASTNSIELVPSDQPIAAVSPVETTPAPTRVRASRPKRSTARSRVASARTPVVQAVAEASEAVEESPTAEATELTADATAEAPAEGGGVALPRPTAIPVVLPGDGGGTYDPGPGTVIRGGGVFGDDHCQIHGRGGVYGRPVYRQPRDRGPSLGDRIRGAQTGRPSAGRGPSVGDRIRAAQSSSRASSNRTVGSRSTGGSMGDRIRAARGARR